MAVKVKIVLVGIKMFHNLYPLIYCAPKAAAVLVLLHLHRVAKNRSSPYPKRNKQKDDKIVLFIKDNKI